MVGETHVPDGGCVHAGGVRQPHGSRRERQPERAASRRPHRRWSGEGVGWCVLVCEPKPALRRDSNVRAFKKMAERSRRTGASKQSNAKSSVAELVALRKSGKKRADAFELKEEENVYDMVRSPPARLSIPPTHTANCGGVGCVGATRRYAVGANVGEGSFSFAVRRGVQNDWRMDTEYAGSQHGAAASTAGAGNSSRVPRRAGTPQRRVDREQHPLYPVGAPTPQLRCLATVSQPQGSRRENLPRQHGTSYGPVTATHPPHASTRYTRTSAC